MTFRTYFLFSFNLVCCRGKKINSGVYRKCSIMANTGLKKTLEIEFQLFNLVSISNSYLLLDFRHIVTLNKTHRNEAMGNG